MSQRSMSTNMAAPPLLVTVAPELSGKADYVKTLTDSPNIFSVHSVPHVFEKLPVKNAIGLTDSEQMLVTMTLFNKLKLTELHDKLELKARNVPLMRKLFTILCDCVSDVVDSSSGSVVTNNVESLFQTPTLDIFIPQAMPYAETKAINQLKQALHHSVDSVVIFDTNMSLLDPSAVKDIMESASAAGRPIRFVRWGSEVVRVSFADLVSRNIQNYLLTGRYIPIKVIYDGYVQAEHLVRELRLETHTDYARWAGLEMDTRGYIDTQPSSLLFSGSSPLRGTSTGRSDAPGGGPGGSSRVNGRPKSRYDEWTDGALVTPVQRETHKTRTMNDDHLVMSETGLNHAPEGFPVANSYSSYTPQRESQSHVTPTKLMTPRITTPGTAKTFTSSPAATRNIDVLKYIKERSGRGLSLNELAQQSPSIESNVMGVVHHVTDSVDLCEQRSISEHKGSSSDNSSEESTISAISTLSAAADHSRDAARVEGIKETPLEEMQRQLHEAWARVDELESENTLLREDCERKDSELHALSEHLRVSEQKVTLLSSDISAVDALRATTVHTLEETVVAAKSSAAAAQKAYEFQQSLISELETDKNMLNARISELENRLSQADISISQRDEELLVLEGSLSDLKAELEQSRDLMSKQAIDSDTFKQSCRAEIEMLQSELSVANDECARLASELSNLTVVMTEKESASHSQVIDLESSLERARENAAQVESRAQEQLESSQTLLLAANAECARLTEELREMALMVSEKDEVSAEQSELILSLRSQVHQLDDSLNQARLDAERVEARAQEQLESNQAVQSAVMEKAVNTVSLLQQELVETRCLLETTQADLDGLQHDLVRTQTHHAELQVVYNQAMEQLAEMTELHRVSSELSAEVQYKTHELEVANEANSELSAAWEQSKTELQQVSLDFAEKSDDVAELERAKEELQSRMADLLALLEVSRKETDDATQQLAALTAQCEQSKAEVLTMQSQHVEETTALQEELEAHSVAHEELTESVRHLETQVEDLSVELTGSHTESEQLTFKLAEATRDLSVLSADFELLTQAHDELHRVSETTEQQLEIFSAKCQTLEAQVLEVSAERDALMVSRGELQSTLEQVEMDRTTSNLQLAALQSEFSALTEKSQKKSDIQGKIIDTLKSQRAKGENELADEKAVAMKLRADLSASQATVDSQALDLSSLQFELKVAESELGAERQSLVTLTCELSDLKQLSDTRIADLLQEVSVKDNAVAESTGPREQLSEQVSRVRDLESHMEQLGMELADVQERHAVADRELLKRTAELSVAQLKLLELTLSSDKLSKDLIDLRAAFSSEKDTLSTERDRLADEKNAALLELTSAKDKMTSLQSELAAFHKVFQTKVDIQTKLIDTLRTQQEKSTTQFQSEQTAQAKAITELHGRCEALLAERDDLSAQLSTMQAQTASEKPKSLAAIDVLREYSQACEKQLKEHISKLTQELNDSEAVSRETIESLQNDLKESQRVSSDKEAEVVALQRELADALQAHQSKVDVYTKAMEALKLQRTESVNQLQAEKQSNAKLQSAVDMLNGILECQRKESSDELSRSQTSFETIIARIQTSHEASVQELAAESTDLKAKLASASEQITALEGELKSTKSSHETKLNLQMKVIDTLKAQRTETANQLQTEKHASQKILSQNDALQGEIENLMHQLTTLQSEFTTAQVKAEENVDLLRQQALANDESYCDQIVNLESQLESLKTDVESKTTCLEHANERVLALESDLSVAHSDIDALQDDICILQDEVQSANEQVTQQAYCIETQSENLEASEAHVFNLSSQLEEAIAHVELLEERLVIEAESLREADAIIETLQEELGFSQAELETWVLRAKETPPVSGELTAMVSKLQSQVADNVLLVSSLAEERDTLRAASAGGVADSESVDALKLQLQNVRTSAADQVAVLQAEIDSFGEKHKSKLDVQANVIQTLKQQRAESINQLLQAKAVVGEHENTVLQLVAELQTIKTALTTSIDEVEQLTAQLKSVTLASVGLREELDIVTVDKSTLREELDIVNNARAALFAEKETLVVECARLVRELESATRYRDQTVAADSGVKTHNSDRTLLLSSEQNATVSTEERGALIQQSAALEAVQAELHAQRELYASETDAWQTIQMSTEKRLSVANSAIADLKRQCQSASESLALESQKARDAESSIGSLTLQFGDERSMLTAEVSSLQSKLINVTAELEHSASVLTDKEWDLQSLSVRVNELEEHLLQNSARDDLCWCVSSEVTSEQYRQLLTNHKLLQSEHEKCLSSPVSIAWFANELNTKTEQMNKQCDTIRDLTDNSAKLSRKIDVQNGLLNKLKLDIADSKTQCTTSETLRNALQKQLAAAMQSMSELKSMHESELLAVSSDHESQLAQATAQLNDANSQIATLQTEIQARDQQIATLYSDWRSAAMDSFTQRMEVMRITAESSRTDLQTRPSIAAESVDGIKSMVTVSDKSIDADLSGHNCLATVDDSATNSGLQGSVTFEEIIVPQRVTSGSNGMSTSSVIHFSRESTHRTRSQEVGEIGVQTPVSALGTLVLSESLPLVVTTSVTTTTSKAVVSSAAGIFASTLKTSGVAATPSHTKQVNGKPSSTPQLITPQSLIAQLSGDAKLQKKIEIQAGVLLTLQTQLKDTNKELAQLRHQVKSQLYQLETSESNAVQFSADLSATNERYLDLHNESQCKLLLLEEQRSECSELQNKLNHALKASGNATKINATLKDKQSALLTQLTAIKDELASERTAKDQLLSSIKSLNGGMLVKEQELLQLNNTHEQLIKENCLLKAAVSGDTFKEMQTLNRKLDIQTNIITSLKADKEVASAEKQRCVEELQKLRVQCHDLSVKLSDFQQSAMESGGLGWNTLSEPSGTDPMLEQQLVECREQCAQQQAVMSMFKTQSETQLKNVVTVLSELQTENSKLKEEVTQLTTAADEADSKSQVQASLIESLKRDSQVVDALTSELTEAKSQLVEAKGELTKVKQSLDRANFRVKDVQEDMEATTATFEMVQRQSMEVKRENAELRKTQEVLKRESSKHQSQSHKLEQELRDVRLELVASQASLAGATERIETTETQNVEALQTLQSDLDNARVSCVELTGRVADLTAELQMSLDTCNSLQEELAAFESHNSAELDRFTPIDSTRSRHESFHSGHNLSDLSSDSHVSVIREPSTEELLQQAQQQIVFLENQLQMKSVQFQQAVVMYNSHVNMVMGQIMASGAHASARITQLEHLLHNAKMTLIKQTEDSDELIEALCLELCEWQQKDMLMPTSVSVSDGVVALTAECDELRSQLLLQDDELCARTEQRDSLQSAITVFESQLLTASVRIAELESSLSAAQELINDQSTDLRTVNDLCDSVSAELITAETKHDQLTLDLRNALQLADTLVAENAEHCSVIDQLFIELSVYKNKLQATQDSLLHATATVNEANKMITVLTSQSSVDKLTIANHVSDVEALCSEKGTLEADIAQLTRDVDGLTGKLNESERVIAALESELEEANQHIGLLTSELQGLRMDKIEPSVAQITQARGAQSDATSQSLNVTTGASSVVAASQPLSLLSVESHSASSTRDVGTANSSPSVLKSPLVSNLFSFFSPRPLDKDDSKAADEGTSAAASAGPGEVTENCDTKSSGSSNSNSNSSSRTTPRMISYHKLVMKSDGKEGVNGVTENDLSEDAFTFAEVESVAASSSLSTSHTVSPFSGSCGSSSGGSNEKDYAGKYVQVESAESQDENHESSSQLEFAYCGGSNVTHGSARSFEHPANTTVAADCESALTPVDRALFPIDEETCSLDNNESQSASAASKL